ncbi:MAG: hypothetical protein WCK77_24670 [Verrucomicrobiota bacterium]
MLDFGCRADAHRAAHLPSSSKIQNPKFNISSPPQQPGQDICSAIHPALAPPMAILDFECLILDAEPMRIAQLIFPLHPKFKIQNSKFNISSPPQQPGS